MTLNYVATACRTICLLQNELYSPMLYSIGCFVVFVPYNHLEFGCFLSASLCSAVCCCHLKPRCCVLGVMSGCSPLLRCALIRSLTGTVVARRYRTCHTKPCSRAILGSNLTGTSTEKQHHCACSDQDSHIISKLLLVLVANVYIKPNELSDQA